MIAELGTVIEMTQDTNVFGGPDERFFVHI
jgi:hypothetical protein